MEEGMRKKDKSMANISRKIVFIIAFILFFMYAMLILYFFIYGFLISVKNNQNDYLDDLMARKLFSWPKNFTLKNYITTFKVWTEIDNTNTYLDMVWNSVWRTVLSAFLSWFSQALVCYVLVHYKSKFTNVIYVLGLLVAMLPLYGSQGAAYRLYKNLNFINNPLISVVSINLYGAYFFYMYAFWKGISHSYMEAAEIDGANDYQILFMVMLPQVLPSIIALFVMQFIASWNDYESTAAYMTKYPNLAYGIYAYSEIAKYAGNIPAYFAGVLLALVPILALFIAFQDTIMEKVYFGGLKE